MSASRKHTVLPSWTPPGLVVPVDQSSTRPLVLRPVLQLCCLSRFSPSLCLSPSLLSHVSLGCGLRRRNHLPRQTRLALRKLKCAVRHRPGMSLSLQNAALVEVILSRAALECQSRRQRSLQLSLSAARGESWRPHMTP